MRKYGWLFVLGLLEFYITVINTIVTEQPLSSLYVPTDAYNSYKIFKLLKSFKVIIFAPTCFGLHKQLSGCSQPVLRQSYNVDIGYIYRYLKLSVLWLHILFSTVMRVDRGTVRSGTPHGVELRTVHDPHAQQDWTKYAATVRVDRAPCGVPLHRVHDPYA